MYGGQQGGQDQRRVRGESGARGLTSRRCSYSETLTNEEIVQDLQFNEIIKSIEQATQNIKMFLQLVMENLYFVNQNLTYL